ncbi:hypothetical protein ACGFJC_48935 [Nonomuraea fuscirosea]|uniref:hypothetical protein n=1 Tax=Nonomuraea fuscirosea TaxID=1291556 RepID=UPI003433BE03
MGTGSNGDRVNFSQWQLLKTVVGKDLVVTVTDVDISSSWELRPRQSSVTWNPAGYSVNGATAFIPQNRTWPTGGVWIMVQNNGNPGSTDVHFDWRPGNDV